MIESILNNIGIEVLIIVMIIGILLLIPKLAVLFLKAIVQGSIGAIIMLAVNFVLTPLGLFVGINIITVAVVGILGLPGLLSLYILQFII